MCEKERNTEAAKHLKSFLEDENDHLCDTSFQSLLEMDSTPPFPEQEVVSAMEMEVDGQTIPVIETTFELEMDVEFESSNGADIGVNLSVEAGGDEKDNVEAGGGKKENLEDRAGETKGLGGVEGKKDDVAGVGKEMEILEAGEGSKKYVEGVESERENVETGGGQIEILEAGKDESKDLDGVESERENVEKGGGQMEILEAREGEGKGLEGVEKKSDQAGIEEKEDLEVGGKKKDNLEAAGLEKVNLETRRVVKEPLKAIGVGPAGYEKRKKKGEYSDAEKKALKKVMDKYRGGLPGCQPNPSKPVVPNSPLRVEGVPTNVESDSLFNPLLPKQKSVSPKASLNNKKKSNVKRLEKPDSKKKITKRKINFTSWNSKLETILNVKYQESYNFTTKARKIHKDFAKTVPKYLIRKKEYFAPSKPLSLKMECEKGKFVIRTHESYNKFDVIMNCYGELQEKKGNKYDKETFVTKFNMVLNGKDSGYFWKYIKESCVPNCKFEEAFVTTDDDSSTPTYLCSLVALKDIKKGETLRVDPNHLRGLPPRDFDCSCGEEGCVKDITCQFRCGIAGCPERGRAFTSAMAIKYHMNSKHGEKKTNKTLPEGNEKEKRKKDQEKTSKELPKDKDQEKKFSCPVKNCKSKFVQRVSLYRHLRECHEMEQFKCPKCGKMFARKQTLENHRKTACKGNKVDKDGKSILNKGIKKKTSKVKKTRKTSGKK